MGRALGATGGGITPSLPAPCCSICAPTQPDEGVRAVSNLAQTVVYMGEGAPADPLQHGSCVWVERMLASRPLGSSSLQTVHPPLYQTSIAAAAAAQTGSG
jgi:hypothetical protein